MIVDEVDHFPVRRRKLRQASLDDCATIFVAHDRLRIVADGGASCWRDLSLGHVANGLVGFLFAASGPLAIVLAAGTKGGLSESDLASWVFGSLCVNGLVSIIFCLRYRQPLVFFWTIPGTVLIAPRSPI